MGITVKPASHTPGYSNSRAVIGDRSIPVVTHGDRGLGGDELDLVRTHISEAELRNDDDLGLIVTTTTIVLAQFDLTSGRCCPLKTWDRDGD